MNQNNSYVVSQQSHIIKERKFVIVGIIDMSSNQNPFDCMETWLIDATDDHDAIKKCIKNDTTSTIQGIINNMIYSGIKYVEKQEIIDKLNKIKIDFEQHQISILDSDDITYLNFIDFYLEDLAEIFEHFRLQNLFIRINQF